MVQGKQINGPHNLSLIARTQKGPGLLSYPVQSRQRNTQQNGDDGHHHQELDQGESDPLVMLCTKWSIPESDRLYLQKQRIHLQVLRFTHVHL